jgi:Putative beta-lactamase-inhibitor-like, PepSY-like
MKMKTKIAMLALGFGISFAHAQKMKDTEIPKAVKDAFAKKYTGSKAEKWEKEGADYEVEFHLNKTESSAVFEADGTFKELEQAIKIAELPKTVTDYCTKTYAGYKLSEAAKITDATGKLMYEAEMKKGKEHFDLIFDEKGGFSKKSTPSMEVEKKD